MTLSMYQASVPVLLRGLDNLSTILKIGAEDAAARKIDEAVFLNSRLAPDMFPLTRQVQIACDGSVRCAARIAGIDIPSFPDGETTFAELQTRIEKAQAFLKTVKPEQLDGSEAREFPVPMREGSITFTGQTFLFGWSLPNFFFHITATYLILRHNGVALGKANYLGGL